eukprot:9475771-Pyramimonas_sp.AAC.1
MASFQITAFGSTQGDHGNIQDEFSIEIPILVNKVKLAPGDFLLYAQGSEKAPAAVHGGKPAPATKRAR